jgi:hypothetical protein
MQKELGSLFTRLWESDSGRAAGTLVWLGGPEGDWFVALTAEGHYRSTSPDVVGELVYVIQTESGSVLLSPKEFAEKCNWKNDPDKVRLDGK